MFSYSPAEISATPLLPQSPNLGAGINPEGKETQRLYVASSIPVSKMCPGLLSHEDNEGWGRIMSLLPKQRPTPPLNLTKDGCKIFKAGKLCLPGDKDTG